MAGDIVIRFTGDASGLAQFYAGVANQTDAFVNRLQKNVTAQLSLPGSQGGLGLQTLKIPRFDANGNPMFTKEGAQIFRNVGTEVGKVKLQIDDLNNVLKLTAETGIRLSNGTFIPVGTEERIRGNAKAFKDLELEMGQVIATQDRVNAKYAQYKTLLNERGVGLQQNVVDPAEAQLKAAQASRAIDLATRDAATRALRLRAQGRFEDDQGTIHQFGPLSGASQTAFDQHTLDLMAERRALTQQLAISTRDLAAAQEAYDAALADPRISANATALARLEQNATARRAQLQGNLAALEAKESQLYASAPTEFPAGFRQLQQLNAGKLIQQLQKGGLATSAEGLYNQEASFQAPVRNLITGVTRVGGAFKNAQGFTTEWSAELDKTGNSVTRFGGNLSGVSRITEQISRNFQKVIEWTVATTVVFGALAAATQGLDVIKQLDADLTRFGVTANLTKQQTKSFYDQLFQVAQVTATPIEELVKAADDLALAVRRPGETVKQLTSDVTTLGTAIGIYTNLTGEDTVSATDELVAVMKQLGLTAGQVYGVLNKVTAAAGGQSGAISDITKGLAVMAEAGKQANLTVDQQIGVIKTLSQVTSKSPAEIATSFKNLVGALSNPAAIKALKSYNIGLISEGNSIIDIYTQVADKIRTGVIAPNDISGLLRAISGGPRRSPDAAALLANINQVLKETTVSQNATNEAFLANAQIVDTLQAKFTIFQNTLKDKTFQQFGEVFRDAATAGIAAITQLLNLVSLVPPGFITIGIEILALLTAFKLFQKVLGALGLSWNSVTESIGANNLAQSANIGITSKETVAILEQTKALAANNAERAAGAVPGGIGGRGAALRAGAMGALLGAGLGLAAGGGLPQIAGGGLQGLGLGLLTLPEPTLITKVIGGIALLGGTILSLQGNTEEANKTIQENAQLLTSSYESAKQAGDSLKAISEDQKNIQGNIDALKKTDASKRTTDDQAALNDLYTQYAKNIQAATDAQIQLNEATDDFAKAQSGQLGTVDWKATLTKAVLEGLPDDQISQVLKDAQATLLAQQFPNIKDYTGEGIKKSNIGTNILRSGIGEDTTATYKFGTVGHFGALQTPTTVPITDNLEPSIARDFFTNGKFTAQIDLTETAIARIKAALDKLGDENLKAAFDDFITGKDAIKDAATNLEYFQKVAENTRAEGLPQIADQMDAILAIAKNLGSTDAFKTLGPQKFAELNNLAFNSIREAGISGKNVPDEAIKALSEGYALLQEKQQGLNLDAGQHKALVDSIAETINSDWVPALQRVVSTTVEISKETQQLADDVKAAVDGILSGVAGKSADLFKRLLSGEINTKQYGRAQAQLNATAQAARRVNKAFQDAKNEGGNAFVDSLDHIRKSLKNIPGLEDATSLSADKLIERLFSLADTYNLNGVQVDKLGGKINKLFKALEILSKVHAVFTITGRMDLRQLIAAYTLLNSKTARLSTASGVRQTIGGTTGGTYGPIIAGLKKLQNALYGGDNNKSLRDLYASGNGGGGTGGGGGGGTGGGTNPGHDVSDIDLPDEIANATNRHALIREAIKRARNLQDKIPGANKDAKNDIVELLKGTQRILEVRGVKDDYLRKALEELAAVEQKRLDFETKADTIRRIRVSGGDFAAIANVPVNSQTGVSLGGPNGPINVTLNLNGTVLTPAQFSQFADKIAAALKRQLAK